MSQYDSVISPITAVTSLFIMTFPFAESVNANIITIAIVNSTRDGTNYSIDFDYGYTTAIKVAA